MTKAQQRSSRKRMEARGKRRAPKGAARALRRIVNAQKDARQ